MAWGRKEQTQNHSQDFTPEIKLRAKDRRYKEDGIPRDVTLEIDHTIPKHLGGSGDEDNAVAVTLAEHGLKHFLGAFFGELEQIPEAEWMGARQVIARMSREDFSKFLAHVEPLIPDLKQRLLDKAPKKKR